MNKNEAIKTLRDYLTTGWRKGTAPESTEALAALDSLAANSKDLELEIQTLVQENFWELAGKPAVEPNEDVEGVVRDISTLCHTKAAAYFDWDMCSRIITARDERIRREERNRCEDIVCGLWPDQDAIRAAIMGGKA